ncbi:MAG: hypothetical protein IID17_02165 [Nitrospinae bacterium]|nr:hypothetical protein [Nitrospinota bacterium]
MTNQNTVLFLGSGATTGSGITKNKQALPTDANFFTSLEGLIKNWEKSYPALAQYRELKKSKVRNGLYPTWNDLFIFRGMAQAGVIKENEEVKDNFYDLSNHDWPSKYKWRKKHYHHQFQIMKSWLPFEYYLAELAIWDLRVLVKDIFFIKNFKKKINNNFWGKLKKVYTISAVVNLNYDTTFDDSFKNVFYYPGEPRPKNNKNPLIRPHGSLKWTSLSLYSKTQNNWEGWTDNYIDTPLKKIGYRELNNDPTKLSFKQPLIVTPAIFKEEIVGNSSFPGLTNPILRLQWNHLERALRNSNHWIIIGFSFASGDEHLKYLLKRFSEKKKVCVSIYDKDWRILSLAYELNLSFCTHEIGENESIEEFCKVINLNKCKNRNN